MVSPDTSAGSEEETSLGVPAHATRLHLRWEKKKIVPVDTSTTSEESEMLPPDLRKLMEEKGDFGNLSGLSEEEIPELYKRIKKRVQIQRHNLLELEERKSRFAPSTQPLDLLNDIQDVRKEIDRLVKIQFEFERWRPKTL